MRKRTLIIVIVVVACAAVVVWQLVGRRRGDGGRTYEFAELERGDLTNIISATGTLSAVGTVEVGTQVSGIVEQVLADFNDDVQRGRVLAVLDTTFLAASVRDARANVLKAQAQYDKAVRDHERASDMFERGLISDAELEEVLTNMMSSRGSLLSAEANLERSRVNLDYAVIRSPIDGTVIMRRVEEGQTVAASLSAPTLFVIAEDLADMEIRALVDESDIGQIREGMTATFTVEAYFDDEFEGVVRQIWLQPETIQNVVNYTVVLDAANDEGLLYPGMTATIDFVVDEVHDVLLVPNAAMRFRPTMSMFAEMRERMMANMSEEERAAAREKMAARGGGAGAGGMGDGGHAPGGLGGRMFGESSEDSAGLWYLDENGDLGVARVKIGVTDGRSTEVVSGGNVSEGMQVITFVEEPEEDEGGSNNPLSTMPYGRRRR